MKKISPLAWSGHKALNINEVGARCYKYTGCPTRVVFPGLRPGPWKSIIHEPNSIAWLK
jgi:hypothetical protein